MLGLGWFLFRGAPVVLDGLVVADDAWGPLGLTPVAAAFYVVVNLHHFAMDPVICRHDHSPTRHLLTG